MTVEYEGFDYASDSDVNIAMPLTVPAGTELLLLFIGGKRVIVDWLNITDLSVDGDAIVLEVDTASQTADQQCWIGYIVNPSTGSQTLSGTLDYPPQNGLLFTTVYLSGVDTDAPIEGSKVNTSGDDVAAITGDPSSGSMMLGIAVDEDTVRATGDSQTEVKYAGANNSFTAVGYEVDEDDFYGTGPGKNPTAAAVVIATAEPEPPVVFIRPSGMLLGVY